MIITQYHAFCYVVEFGLLLRMCLASLKSHAEWISRILVFNLVVRTTSEQLKQIKEENWVIASYPWSTPHLNFSGIQLYCSLLQHIGSPV